MESEELKKKIIQDAKNANINSINGTYIRTKKNELVSNFYKNMGFRLVTEDKDKSEWILEVKESKIEKPEFIKLED